MPRRSAALPLPKRGRFTRLAGFQKNRPVLHTPVVWGATHPPGFQQRPAGMVENRRRPLLLFAVCLFEVGALIPYKFPLCPAMLRQ